MPNTIDFPNADTTVYSVKRTYPTLMGRMQLPVNGGNAVFVKMCDPVQGMRIDFTAVREGGPPTVPDPLTFSQDTNIVLLSSAVSAMIPVEIGPGLGHAWQVGGTYVYGLRQPIALNSPIPTGKCPWETIGVDENLFPATKFSTGILATESGVVNLQIPFPGP